MPAFRIGPEAESVVVLGGEDDPAETRILGDSRPLVAVQVRGLEKVFRFRSLAPFKAGECVGAEVDEHIHLHSLPRNLGCCRQDSVRFRRLIARGGGQYRKHDRHLPVVIHCVQSFVLKAYSPFRTGKSGLGM